MTPIELLAVLRLLIKWIIDWAAILIVVAMVISYLINSTPYGRDDSDVGKWFGKRSGLSVMTDNKTGLQYLVTSKGGITPRLDSSGKQLIEVTE